MTNEEAVAACEAAAKRSEDAATRAEAAAGIADTASEIAKKHSATAQTSATTAKQSADLAGEHAKLAEAHSNTAVDAADKAQDMNASVVKISEQRGMPPKANVPVIKPRPKNVAAAASIIGLFFNIDPAIAREKYINAKDDAQEIEWAKEILEETKKIHSNNDLGKRIIQLEANLNDGDVPAAGVSTALKQKNNVAAPGVLPPVAK